MDQTCKVLLVLLLLLIQADSESARLLEVVLGVNGKLCCEGWAHGVYLTLCVSLCVCVIGVVSGLLGQQNDFSMFPSYLLSMGFAMSLKRSGSVYWPGCSFGMVRNTGGGVVAYIEMTLQLTL